MFCKYCGNQLNDDEIFCPFCGKELKKDPPLEERAATQDQRPSQIPSAQPEEVSRPSENALPIPPQAEQSGSVPPNVQKRNKTIDRCLHGGYIAGAVGAIGLLLIVFIGLIGWGKVYFFNGYVFTAVLTGIALALMLIGLVCFFVKIILVYGCHIGEPVRKIVWKVLTPILAALCFAFSIWCVVDASRASRANFLHKAFDAYNCAAPWAYCYRDSIRIDSNPYDYDGDSSYALTYILEATSAIKALNAEFGIPSYIYDDMMKTTSLSGRQEYRGQMVTVTWTYHPDKGLEVTYRLN